MEENISSWQRFRQLLRKNMHAAQGRRKDEVDVLRTAFWFAEIKARLNASTAYEIERLLEPEAFGKNKDGDHIHRNKWSKYEVGQHVPCDSLVTRVDAKLPGSKRVLNHVLWEVLRAKHSIKELADDLLRQLTPEIQVCVFRIQRYRTSDSHHRISSSRRQLTLLERRSGIDALACLTILLRESSEQGENPHSIDIGKSIYRMLLVLCSTGQFGDFTQEIFDIYRDKIFSLPRHKGIIFRLKDSDFIDAVKLLTIIVLQVEDKKKFGTDGHGLNKVMYKFLDGDYGFDVKFALDPSFGPSEPFSDMNSKEWEDFEVREKFRQWGKEQLSSSNIREVLPPAELWRPTSRI